MTGPSDAPELGEQRAALAALHALQLADSRLLLPDLSHWEAASDAFWCELVAGMGRPSDGLPPPVTAPAPPATLGGAGTDVGAEKEAGEQVPGELPGDGGRPGFVEGMLAAVPGGAGGSGRGLLERVLRSRPCPWLASLDTQQALARGTGVWCMVYIFCCTFCVLSIMQSAT